jgi:hypothetical protein
VALEVVLQSHVSSAWVWQVVVEVQKCQHHRLQMGRYSLVLVASWLPWASEPTASLSSLLSLSAAPAPWVFAQV